MNLFIKLLGSGVLVQILTILSTLVFSRIFTVNQFGDLAFYASFGSIMAVIGGLRFDYIILKESIKDKEIGYLLSNMVSVVINFFVVIIIFLLQTKFKLVNHINLMYLFLFGLGFSFFNNISQYFISIKKYNIFIYLRLIQIFGVFVIGLTLKYVFDSFDALLYAYSISQFVFGVVGMFYIIGSFGILSKSDFYRFFTSNFSESCKNFFISFMQYSTPLVPVLIGGYLFDQKNIGAYFVFSQMISAPLNVFRRNLLVFFNGEFGERDKFLNFLKKKLYSVRNIIIFTGLLVFGSSIAFFLQEKIVELILGNQWVDYSYLLLPLAIYFLFDCILQPFTTLLPLWGKVNFSLSMEAFRFILLVGCLPIITLYFKFSFLEFLFIYIVIMLSVYIAIVFRVVKLSKSEDGKSI